MAARHGHCMAFDSRRGIMVMFGGRSPSESNETWERVGATWVRRIVAGPSARTDAAMTYDRERQRIVLFGGYRNYFGEGPRWFGDTWEWDGSAWEQRDAPGPSPRSGAAMVYDTQRRVATLFGGSSGGLYNDETWEWNGLTWTQRHAPGPQAREYHAMSYDSARGVTVLFGGSVHWQFGERNDTWEWDGEHWNQRFPLISPSPRAAHALAFDAFRNRSVTVGGFGGNNDTWEWDGIDWVEQFGEGPPPRSEHAIAFDRNRDRVVLVGGREGEFEPTWEWDGCRWSAEIVAPPVRFGHDLAFDEARGVMLLTGGYTWQNWDYSPDTWELGPIGWRVVAADGPPVRANHATVFDPEREVLVLFGGRGVGPSGETIFRNDTWEWNGQQWSQRSSTGPSPRESHVMAFDRKRGVTLLFGGSRPNFNSNETWEWDGRTWSLRSTSGPNPDWILNLLF
jgi:hypothetical protein